MTNPEENPECGAIGALIVGGRVVGSIHCDLEKGHDEEQRVRLGEHIPGGYRHPGDWADNVTRIYPATDHAMTLRWRPEEDPDLDLFDAAEKFDLNVELVEPTAIPPELCGMGGCVFTPHAYDAPHSWENWIDPAKKDLGNGYVSNTQPDLP